MGAFFGPFANPAANASGSGGIGSSINFAPAGGSIDPAIAGFHAGLGSNGTGRLKVTLTADTSFQGLPAGLDGQQLYITVVSGAFNLTLLHLNGATAQKQIRAGADTLIGLNDSLQLFYDGGLSQWVLIP